MDETNDAFADNTPLGVVVLLLPAVVLRSESECTLPKLFNSHARAKIISAVLSEQNRELQISDIAL